jgi:hypothetical protein
VRAPADTTIKARRPTTARAISNDTTTAAAMTTERVGFTTDEGGESHEWLLVEWRKVML